MDTHTRSSLRKRILIADDEPILRELLGYYLAREGYALTFASDGLEAWQHFQRAPFDLVITDRDMPGMNGEDLADAIRQSAPHLPIVLISGHRGLTVDPARFDAFLPKPFAREQLTDVIGALLLSSTSRDGALQHAGRHG